MRTEFKDLQSVYDHVCRHLAAQGFRSTKVEGGMLLCTYRDGRGASCAVGCLIPDHRYKASMEGYTVATLMRDGDLPSFCRRGRYSFFEAMCLSNLQTVHDDKSSWLSGDAMIQRLRRTAMSYDLDPSLLDRLDFGTIVPDRLD